MSNTLAITVRRNDSATPPDHHVFATTEPTKGWSSYLPSWNPAPGPTRAAKEPTELKSSRSSTSSLSTLSRRTFTSKKKDHGNEITGFRNPWPSWHKATKFEVWQSLEWGEDTDPCIDLAASHIKVPVAGPIRSYPPPCTVEDLPEVDVVTISHSHYDHLDYDTIMTFWKYHRATVRFLVPLGNKKWFVECGIDADRVTELDWWDCAQLAPSQSTGQVQRQSIEVTCTPSQHNSGRGLDTNETLWCSWYLTHPSANTKDRPYRVYFGGDTGYQFHDSPGWPPKPPKSPAERAQLAKTIAAQVDNDDSSAEAKHPVCPAFKEIRERLGVPHLLFLPIAVGATYDFFRSFAPVPDSVNPIPRQAQGVTAHNHMPSWDAVRVFNVMTADSGASPPGEGDGPPVAIAVHWGTFVTEPVEVLATLGQLQWACEAHGVGFARSLEEQHVGNANASFIALNHGQSVAL
ncbi:hypothetical protein LTR86_010210 [Recurvomyces mirabilis]|nr:hypothetical protein LTR86_010210 [Recurvomyces mirabilis]